MNRYNPKKHHRRSIRLKGYDYSQPGMYFVTICTQNRACLFGKIIDGKMILNDAGEMVHSEWLNLTERFGNIELHEFVVMPNHFHGILEIVGLGESLPLGELPSLGQPPPLGQPSPLGQPQGIAPTSLGDMVGAFESISTVEYIRGVKNNGWKRFNKKLWQRNYWEHIIRDKNEYRRIAKYIINNPQKWENDKFNNG